MITYLSTLLPLVEASTYADAACVFALLAGFALVVWAGNR